MWLDVLGACAGGHARRYFTRKELCGPASVRPLRARAGKGYGAAEGGAGRALSHAQALKAVSAKDVGRHPPRMSLSTTNFLVSVSSNRPMAIPATGCNKGTPARARVCAQLCVCLCGCVHACVQRHSRWSHKAACTLNPEHRHLPSTPLKRAPHEHHPPASSIARQPPHTEAMELEPLLSVMVLSTRTV